MEQKNGYDKLARRKEESNLSNILFGRVPPQARDLEEAVLGAMMLEKEALYKTFGILKAEMFYVDAHQKIFAACSDLFQKSNPIDLLTVTDELRRKGQLEEVGGAYFVTELTSRIASAANIDYHARIIYQKYIAREMIRICSLTIKDCFEDTVDVFDALKDVTKSMLNLQNVGSQKNTEPAYRINKAVTQIEMAMNGKVLMGVPSGLRAIDELTGGWQKQDLITISSRPGCLSGETIIYVARTKDGSGDWMTLKDAYYKFNGLRYEGMARQFHGWDRSIKSKIQCFKSDEQLTGQNEILEIIQSGVKETFMVTTSSGKKIRATKDHKFLVDTNDTYKKLSELSVGDTVFCKAPNVSKGRNKRKTRPEINKHLPYYYTCKSKVINKIKYERVCLHRLSYDAAINNLTVDDFLNEVKTNPNHKLTFSDRSKDIHHVDENIYNNEFSNLLLLSKSEHTSIHTDRKTFGLNYVHEEKIESIERYGEEMTYDICCKAPYHNFLANGFIVHNSGKSALAIAIMDGASRADIPVWMFSLEMSDTQIAMRQIAMETNIKYSRLRTGKISNEEFGEVVRNVDSLANSNIYIDSESRLNSSILIAKLSKAVMEKGIKLAIVDYLNLMESELKSTSKQEKISQIVADLKRAAKQLDIPIILLCQLNREVEKTSDKRPELHHLKESGAIEEYSDIVMLLYRPAYYNENPVNAAGESEADILYVDIAKHKQGATGDVRLHCEIDKNIIRDIEAPFVPLKSRGEVKDFVESEKDLPF